MPEKKYNTDIFEILANIDAKNIDYIDKIEKDFNAYVIMQWMAGLSNPRTVFFLNELVNPFVWAFVKRHKRLLYYLMTVCADGHKKRYRWIKSKKTHRHPKSVEIIQKFYGYNSQHAVDALPCFSKEDIIEMAEQLGYQKEFVKLIKKEFA